jgi:hypothetical protein
MLTMTQKLLKPRDPHPPMRTSVRIANAETQYTGKPGPRRLVSAWNRLLVINVADGAPGYRAS